MFLNMDRDAIALIFVGYISELTLSLFKYQKTTSITTLAINLRVRNTNLYKLKLCIYNYFAEVSFFC